MTQQHRTDEHGVTHEADLRSGRLLCTEGSMSLWQRRRHGTVPITCLSCVTRASRPIDIQRILEANSMKGPL